ncbi:MAG: DUF6282 family protein [Negativicutes bacterium]|nr:DUF6282 family protein [Negativicutes bacterium]
MNWDEIIVKNFGPSYEPEVDLSGIVDLHIHSDPDIRKRRHNDIEIAALARKVGARAIVIKSHVVPTMDRAFILQQLMPEIGIYGGVTLNPQVGGINPDAVEVAIFQGAKIVWLPTMHSSNGYRAAGKPGGVESVVDGKVVPALVEVMKQIAKANIVLATGHLSPQEIFVVVEKAKELGVEKIIINHPENRFVNMSIADQKELSGYGVFFERCYARPVSHGNYVLNFEDNLKAIESVGYQSTIIATDGGQVENPIWSIAMGQHLSYLRQAGLSQDCIDQMIRVNPAKMLGLS